MRVIDQQNTKLEIVEQQGAKMKDFGKREIPKSLVFQDSSARNIIVKKCGSDKKSLSIFQCGRVKRLRSAFVMVAYNWRVFQKSFFTKKLLFESFAGGMKQTVLNLFDVQSGDTSKDWEIFRIFAMLGFH